MTGVRDAGGPILTDEGELQLHLGYQRVKALLDAHPQNDLEPVNLNPDAVVQTVLGTIPEVLPLRPQLAQIGMFNLESVDNLRDYALALGHLQNKLRMASRVADGELVSDLFKIRERLHADAHPLVLRGMLDGAQVNAWRSGNSHRDLAFGTIGLAQLLLDGWDRFGGKLFAERSEVEDARLKGNRLLVMLGAKEQGPELDAAARLERNVCYTLLLRAYSEVRDALLFIRRKERDADEITPSLFAGRRRRKGTGTELSEEAAPEQSAEAASVLGLDLNTRVANAFAPSREAAGLESTENGLGDAVPAPGFPGALPLTNEG